MPRAIVCCPAFEARKSASSLFEIKPVSNSTDGVSGAFRTTKDAKRWASVRKCTSSAASRWSRRAKYDATFIVSRRSEEHTSELQSLMRISDAVFCLKTKNAQYWTRNQQYTRTCATHNQPLHVAILRTKSEK